MSPSHFNFVVMGTVQIVLGAAMIAVGITGFLKVFSAGRGEALRLVLFGLGTALAGYGTRSRQSWEESTSAIGWLGVVCMAAPVMFVALRWLYRRRLGRTAGDLRDSRLLPHKPTSGCPCESSKD